MAVYVMLLETDPRTSIMRQSYDISQIVHVIGRTRAFRGCAVKDLCHYERYGALMMDVVIARPF